MVFSCKKSERNGGLSYLVFGHRRKTGLFCLPGMAKNYQGVRKEPREQTES
nr:MAG TPA: hypothetical protein [Caudoviricetes sp.]